MSGIQQAAESWWAWVVASSWQIAVVICAIAVCVALLKDFSPRLRHGLWLLVLVKIFLPPTITSPWSIGSMLIDPMRNHLPESIPWQGASATGAADSAGGQGEGSDSPAIVSTSTWLFLVWLVGAIIFSAVVLWRYAKILHRVRQSPTIDEGPARVALETISMRLQLRRVPELHVIENTSSPFLLGVLTPRIVMPDSLLRALNEDELHDVLTHELVHWQRRDPWIGWLQFIAQMLFWFHPLVWWANSQLRHQRECVCDEISLRDGDCDPKQYGETIVRVLTVARGRSPAAGGMIGVFEKGSRLQNRVERIMNYEPSKSDFGWASRAIVCSVALVLLPMAPGNGQDTAVKKAKRPTTPYPTIVETIPAQGATDVDPGLDTVTVKFDRDMGGGMSWTGGPPQMPQVDKSRKAQWTDKRTCVLPVKLAAAKIYRVGINSKSYQNFRSAGGTPTPPDVIAFATKGASAMQKMQIRTPKITKIVPDHRATDVESSVKAIRVTFDVPMGDGMSWTGGGEHFPEIPRGKKPQWSRDGKTCILPVKLKPNWNYQLGLNSLSHNNFQSKFGMPLKPVVYTFSTGE